MEPKKKFKPTTYRPQVQSQKDIDEGLKKAFASVRQGRTQQKPLFKPQSFSQQRKPISKAGAPQKPISWQPQQAGWKPFQQKPLTREEPESEQEEQVEEEAPYWSGEDWETWAYDLYVNYPEFREILPEWFIEAIEEEE
jgi:hypothetical protein